MGEVQAMMTVPPSMLFGLMGGLPKLLASARLRETQS